PGGAATLLGLNEVIDPLALDGNAVDVEHALDHLDAVAGQADEPLVVFGRALLRQSKHYDVAALRRARPDPPREQVGRERQRVVAVAVRVFRDEQIVADEQRLLHRAGWNVERLEQKGADDEGDDQRMNDHADGLADAAFFALPTRG